MKKSNYIFKGPIVSMQEHWTGEWELLDSATGDIILLGSKQAIQEEYDKRNEIK